MSLWRKKPVVIEAMAWDGSAAGATPIIDWILTGGGTATFRDDYIDYGHDVQPGDTRDRRNEIAIRTLEGTVTASPGDFVIRGVQGEFYPCKPDIFAATYEQVTA